MVLLRLAKEFFTDLKIDWLRGRRDNGSCRHSTTSIEQCNGNRYSFVHNGKHGFLLLSLGGLIARDKRSSIGMFIASYLTFF